MIRLLLVLTLLASCIGCSSGVGFGFYDKPQHPGLTKPPTHPPVSPNDYYYTPPRY